MRRSRGFVARIETIRPPSTTTQPCARDPSLRSTEPPKAVGSPGGGAAAGPTDRGGRRRGRDTPRPYASSNASRLVIVVTRPEVSSIAPASGAGQRGLSRRGHRLAPHGDVLLALAGE